TQNVEDTHVTLTPVQPDGPQESSSMSSFMTSMLNPISDVGVESIFTTASSPIVSLQTQTPIMTPSTIATITTSSDAPIPSTTIPSIILENLPTFNSAFCFDERLSSLETTFSEYRQTNPFVDAVSAILDIVHQTSYAIAADLSEMELKKILIEKMKGNKSIQRSDEQRNLYKALDEAYDADKAILDTYAESTVLKRRREDDDQEGPSTGLDWGSKRRREGVNRESALDVYSKRRIIAVTELKIVEWHDYKHLDWISIRRDDDQIYKFKEGDFKRLRLPDIEDMLLLL
nr:hypothetical protein [Tanacetum cinerariifolium]